MCELTNVLAGKSGVMAQWYQRHCICMGLEGVRDAVASGEMPFSSSSSLAARAVDGLLPAVEKESHDETRAVGLGCLTRWALMLDALPPKLVLSLKSGIGSTARPTSTIFAAAACQLSGSARLCLELASMVPDLLTRVELGAKKPTVLHADAIYSAKVVLEVAAADPAWVDRVDEVFPWNAIMDEGSFLFPSGVLSPSADAPWVGEAAGPLAPHVCVALCQTILLGASHITERSGDGGLIHARCTPVWEASCFALMRCAVHQSAEVRRVAVETALTMCSVIGGAQASLLGACRKVREERPVGFVSMKGHERA